MAELRFETVPEPSLELRNAIDARLRAHAELQPGPMGGGSFAVTVLDAEGELSGGGWGRASWGTFYLVTLVVPEGARRQGLGRRRATAPSSSPRGPADAAPSSVKTWWSAT